MSKKMKSPIDGLDPQQLQAGLRESAQQIWMAGLGAFAKAQARLDELVRNLATGTAGLPAIDLEAGKSAAALPETAFRSGFCR